MLVALRIEAMDFEWDPDKARANECKHGVSFFEACEVFDDDHSSTARDPDHSLDENRYLIFGMSKGGNTLWYPILNVMAVFD